VQLIKALGGGWHERDLFLIRSPRTRSNSKK
jgi:hypothetical protein